MNDVTQFLDAVARGEAQAAEQLLPIVYEELRQLAAQRLAQERPGQPRTGSGPSSTSSLLSFLPVAGCLALVFLQKFRAVKRQGMSFAKRLRFMQ